MMKGEVIIMPLGENIKVEKDIKKETKQSATKEEHCCCHSHGNKNDNDNENATKWYKSNEFYEIGSGVIIFTAAQIISFFYQSYQLPLLIIAYIILGREILFSACRNIFKGHVFDENFLMAIATLGAFAIGEYPEAVGVMLFFRIGEFFEENAASRSRQAIISAIDMRPETVMLVDRDEKIASIPAEQAGIGDVIMARPGDRIPLDGTVIEGNSQIDTSPLTGEAMPKNVSVGEQVLSGCINKSGAIKIRVEKVLSESMVSRILASVQSAAANKPQIQRFISRFAQVYTPLVIIAAALIAVIPSLITGQWHTYIYTALTFLVISCPCALVLSVPLAFFSGIGTASRQGILFKDGAAIEALSHIKAAALDKTGTITQGVFAVQQIKSYNGFSADEILKLCAAAESASTHPLAVSIVKKAKEESLVINKAAQIQEFSGRGVAALIEGRKIICGNAALMKEHNVNIAELLRGTVIYIAIDGKYAGCIILGDQLKDDAVNAVNRLKKQAVDIAMLTGDSADGAAAAADKAGIKTVYAGLLPEDKLNILQKIRREKGKVMFVGDGINDAPVLANADVGAAMGSGADAAIEAADVVFMTSRMNSIPNAIDLARTTRTIAIQNVAVALGVKLFVMLCGILGYASLWGAVFADTGVAMLCVVNSIRMLYMKDLK